MENVKIRTMDSLVLEGFLFGNASKTGMIFLHGWKDDALSAPFVKTIAEKTRGLFLAFNNRGAEGNGVGERFWDCILDIKAAIDLLAERGCERVYLIGHSTGCQKAVYYLYKEEDARVAGIALIEPTDDAALAEKELGDRYHEAVGLAKRMVGAGDGEKLVPGWARVGGEAAAARFLSMFSRDETEGGIFDYSGELEMFGSIKVGCMIIFGSESQYSDRPEEKLDTLKQKLPGCENRLIEGADHWFGGHEEELADCIILYAFSVNS